MVSNKKKKEHSNQYNKEYNLDIYNALDSIENLFLKLKEKHNIDKNKILELLDKREKTKQKKSIPLSIFSDKLSALESMVKYLRDEHKLKFTEIAKLLYRNPIPISITYKKATQKYPEKLDTNSQQFLPLEIFSDKRLSVLETIVKHLKDVLELSLTDIAKLLNRDPRTIWTVYDRSRRKLEK